MGYPRRTADLVSQNNIFVDITNDRVGIGTDSPQDQLDVLGNITFRSKDAGSSAAPELKLYRDSPSPADADYLGQIKFAGESDTGVERNYAKITGKIGDASNGTEDGIIEIAHIKAGSQNISARWTSSDLKLLNGTGLEVAGNLTVSGNTTIVGTLTYEDVTNIDSVGLVTARSGLVVTGVATATTFSGSGASLTSIPNSALDNSTISGISLGGSLGTLTMAVSGTGLSGSDTYDGSGSTTFTVTSNATSSNTASTIVARDGSGNFTAGTITATNVNSTSDIVKKKNLREVIDSLEVLKGIRGVRFDWVEDDSPSVGVIAQEVEQVLPELVSETDGVKSVNYNGLVGVLIEAVKELQSEVEELKRTR